MYKTKTDENARKSSRARPEAVCKRVKLYFSTNEPPIVVDVDETSNERNFTYPYASTYLPTYTTDASWWSKKVVQLSVETVS